VKARAAMNLYLCLSSIKSSLSSQRFLLYRWREGPEQGCRGSARQGGAVESGEGLLLQRGRRSSSLLLARDLFSCTTHRALARAGDFKVAAHQISVRPSNFPEFRAG
jgi:hypothetical protein